MFLALPVFLDDAEGQLLDLVHGLLWVPAAHELDVGEGLGQTNQPIFGVTVFVLRQELLPQFPVMRGFVRAEVLVHVPRGVERGTHPLLGLLVLVLVVVVVVVVLGQRRRGLESFKLNI